MGERFRNLKLAVAGGIVLTSAVAVGSAARCGEETEEALSPTPVNRSGTPELTHTLVLETPSPPTTIETLTPDVRPTETIYGEVELLQLGEGFLGVYEPAIDDSKPYIYRTNRQEGRLGFVVIEEVDGPVKQRVVYDNIHDLANRLLPDGINENNKDVLLDLLEVTRGGDGDRKILREFNGASAQVKVDGPQRVEITAWSVNEEECDGQVEVRQDTINGHFALENMPDLYEDKPTFEILSTEVVGELPGGICF